MARPGLGTYRGCLGISSVPIAGPTASSASTAEVPHGVRCTASGRPGTKVMSTAGKYRNRRGSERTQDRWSAEQLFPAFQSLGMTDVASNMEFTEYDADELYIR